VSTEAFRRGQRGRTDVACPVRLDGTEQVKRWDERSLLGARRLAEDAARAPPRQPGEPAAQRVVVVVRSMTGAARLRPRVH
jgi:hypothetical protein